MAKTVKAKLLLGWMTREEALQALNDCVFEKPLNEKKMVALWKEYRARVEALEPRNALAPPELPLTCAEQAAVDRHLQILNASPKAAFAPRVIKVDPSGLVAKQFQVLTERSGNYGQQMENEAGRINHCLGVGLAYNGQLVLRQISPKRYDVDLPHPEYVLNVGQLGPNTNFNFQERDRFILGVPAGNRLILWGGYHRTHAVLCHMGGDAAGVAPLLTVMTGIPEVTEFLARPSSVRDTVLGERPALLRDFLDEALFMTVYLRKKRARCRIEQPRPGQFRWRIEFVNDEA